MKKMITPSDLQAKVTPVKVEGNYNWEKQGLECKLGTFNSTSHQTCSGQCNFIDDNPFDNIND